MGNDLHPEIMTLNLDRYARIFSSLRDLSRILVFLAISGSPKTRSELSKSLGIPFETVRWYLQDLAEAGLLDLNIRGRHVYYQSRMDKVVEVMQDLNNFLMLLYSKTEGKVSESVELTLQRLLESHTTLIRLKEWSFDLIPKKLEEAENEEETGFHLYSEGNLIESVVHLNRSRSINDRIVQFLCMPSAEIDKSEYEEYRNRAKGGLMKSELGLGLCFKDVGISTASGDHFAEAKRIAEEIKDLDNLLLTLPPEVRNKVEDKLELAWTKTEPTKELELYPVGGISLPLPHVDSGILRTPGVLQHDITIPLKSISRLLEKQIENAKLGVTTIEESQESVKYIAGLERLERLN